MTDELFFDTDCLSSFLWVGREDIILRRYSKRIVVPQFIYDEFCYPGVDFLRQKLDHMIIAKLVVKMEIIHGTEASKLFREMTRRLRDGHAVIGKGEASALALAKHHSGIVASNNLKDVKIYAKVFGVTLITTSDILVEAFSDGYIDEKDANNIWQDMINKRRKLPAKSFSEYLRML